MIYIYIYIDLIYVKPYKRSTSALRDYFKYAPNDRNTYMALTCNTSENGQRQCAVSNWLREYTNKIENTPTWRSNNTQSINISYNEVIQQINNYKNRSYACLSHPELKRKYKNFRFYYTMSACVRTNYNMPKGDFPVSPIGFDIRYKDIEIN